LCNEGVDAGGTWYDDRSKSGTVSEHRGTLECREYVGMTWGKGVPLTITPPLEKHRLDASGSSTFNLL